MKKLLFHYELKKRRHLKNMFVEYSLIPFFDPLLSEREIWDKNEKYSEVIKE